MINPQLPGIKLPRLGQIGILVYSREKVMANLKELGVGPWILWEGVPEFSLEKKGKIDVSLKIALAFTGGVQIELIEMTGGRSFYNETLENREGLHHLGYMVGNLDKYVMRCNSAGIEVLQRGQIKSKGFTIDYAYMDTQGLCGVIIEFIQTRLGPLPVKMNRLTHNIACWLNI